MIGHLNHMIQTPEYSSFHAAFSLVGKKFEGCRGGKFRHHEFHISMSFGSCEIIS